MVKVLLTLRSIDFKCSVPTSSVELALQQSVATSASRQLKGRDASSTLLRSYGERCKILDYRSSTRKTTSS